jgi:hypothetical protein
VAHLVLTGEIPDIIRPFGIDRFTRKRTAGLQ